MTLDFNEIPIANTNKPDSDTFEKFSREFFLQIGYEIVNEPSRGADGGIDLKIKEIIKDNSNEKVINWLVSCKHYFHSGKGIGVSIEQDIVDRVISNGCDGFIGFYSTIPTSGLMNKLNGLKKTIGYKIFDSQKIERFIVGDPKMDIIFKRFFPKSYQDWKKMNNTYEPIGLVEFYLKNKYPSHFLLKDIFGSINSLIRNLKHHQSLNEAFESNNYTIITIKNEWIKDIREVGVSMFCRESIPCITSQKLGIKITSNKMIKLNFVETSSEIKDFYIVYLNHIVKSEGYNSELETAYMDLREALGYG